MAIGMIDDSTLYDIGDAIREKNGSTIEYLPSEMPDAIRDIAIGMTLPELGDTAAVPTDIVSGKTLYDDDGNPVTGTMTSLDSEYSSKPNSDGSGNVIVGLMHTENAYLPAWNELRFKLPLSEFGNATEDDVLADIEFTSSVGLLARGNIPKKTASDITVNGATVTISRGYYESAVSKSVATATQATPSISVDTAGKITASATQTAGYVSAGTQTATRQLTTQAEQTITPSTSDQTISSGKYLTGTQTIQGDANLVAANIKKGVSIFGVEGTLESDSGSGGMYGWRKHTVSSAYKTTSEKLGTTAPSDLGSTYYNYTITNDGYYQLGSGNTSLNTYHLPTGAVNGKTKYIYYKQWGYASSTYYKWTLSDTKIQAQGDFLGYVTSNDANTYVSNGVDTDGYWYVSLDT